MIARKILFWLHLTAGCLAGVVIVIMSVTGVLLTYERQIVSWADRDYRSVPPTANSARLPIESLLAGVNPLPSAITMRSDPAAPVELSFGRDHVSLVDAYSGKVLGEASTGVRSFFSNVENVHRWLGVSAVNRTGGRAVTGACNLAFLILVASGPFLWIPRKWSWQSVKAVALFRLGLSGRAREFNWHNVIGIWCALPLFVIVLSGVVMSYPWANNLVYRLTGNEPPSQNSGARPDSQPRRQANRAAAPKLQGLNAAWQHAEQQIPAWRSITLRLPPSGRGPLAFTIDAGNGGRPDQRSQLTLNPRTGEIIRWEPFSSLNAGRRLRSWLRFLHTGEALGAPGQTIAGLASTGAVVLVWTGLWLACRRLIRSRKRQRSVVEAPREQVTAAQ